MKLLEVAKMNFGTSEEKSMIEEIDIPTDIDWQMLGKSKFFILNAALFFHVSTTLYSAVVLKNQKQVS